MDETTLQVLYPFLLALLVYVSPCQPKARNVQCCLATPAPGIWS